MPKLSLLTCILAIAICSPTLCGQRIDFPKGLAKASHPMKTAAIKVTAYPENYLDTLQQPAADEATSVQAVRWSNLWVLTGFSVLLGVGAAITLFSLAQRKQRRSPHRIAMSRNQ